MISEYGLAEGYPRIVSFDETFAAIHEAVAKISKSCRLEGDYVTYNPPRVIDYVIDKNLMNFLRDKNTP